MHLFLLVYRKAFTNKKVQRSPQGLQNSIRDWQNWHGCIAAQNRLVRPLQCWDQEGVVVSSYNVSRGPHLEISGFIGGMVFIQAENYEGALEIARGCPILKFGGNVEVRMEAQKACR